MKAGQTRHLIFTGGLDSAQEELTAAALMRAHAIALGAPPEALSTENRSISTFENLHLGFAVAEAQGFDSLAILTDAFHLERAGRLARYFGHPDSGLIATAGLAQDSFPNRIWSILREAMAWWFNLAKVAGWEALAATGVDADARRELIK